MNTILKFKLGEWEYGFIEGANGQYIITTDDLIHFISGDGWESLMADYDFGTQQDVYQRVTVAEIKQSGTPVPVSEFVRYWGIKDRICANYSLLLGSMEEIGIDTSDMPEWGAKE